MATKSQQLNVRIPEADYSRLAKMESLTGVEKVTLARVALIALLDYFDETGRVSFPLRVVETNEKESS